MHKNINSNRQNKASEDYIQDKVTGKTQKKRYVIYSRNSKEMWLAKDDQELGEEWMHKQEVTF